MQKRYNPKERRGKVKLYRLERLSRTHRKCLLGSKIVCDLRCEFYVRSNIGLDWRRTEEGKVVKHVC